MKKLFCILFFIVKTSFAQYEQLTYTITNSSLLNVDTVCQNSTQWVDLKQNPANTNHPYYGYVNIYYSDIYNCPGGCNTRFLTAVLWDSLNVNSDGSRGISFVIPSGTTYPPFLISIGMDYAYWGQTPFSGPNSITSNNKNCLLGIKQNTSTQQLLSTEYYNMLGQPISAPNGITIEIKTYVGGYREIRKIITPPN